MSPAGSVIFPAMAKTTKPALNAQQEAFCRWLAEGKTQQQAYIDAGYTGHGRSAETKASRLLSIGNGAPWHLRSMWKGEG